MPARTSSFWFGMHAVSGGRGARVGRW
jgi:hypothetical protein